MTILQIPACFYLIHVSNVLEISAEKCYNINVINIWRCVKIKKVELSDYDKAKRVFIVLAVAALVICSLFLNLVGGIGFYINGYENVGTALFVSSFFLTLSVIFLGKGRMILPAVFDVIGTAGYAYAIKVILDIPHSKVAKQSTEMFAGRIYPAITVTVIVLIVVIMNYFSDIQKAKREARRKKKYDRTNRPLKKDEKIL